MRREGVEPCPPPEIVGYSIRQTASVKIRDFETIGDTLAGVVQNGANSVSQLSFTIDDPTEVRHEARKIAIERAQEKAQRIAEAAGFEVGRLLGIDESGGLPPIYRMEGLGGAADFAQAAAPKIEPGSQEVSVTVTLRYEIR